MTQYIAAAPAAAAINVTIMMLKSGEGHYHRKRVGDRVSVPMDHQ